MAFGSPRYVSEQLYVTIAVIADGGPPVQCDVKVADARTARRIRDTFPGEPPDRRSAEHAEILAKVGAPNGRIQGLAGLRRRTIYDRIDNRTRPKTCPELPASTPDEVKSAVGLRLVLSSGQTLVVQVPDRPTAQAVLDFAAEGLVSPAHEAYLETFVREDGTRSMVATARIVACTTLVCRIWQDVPLDVGPGLDALVEKEAGRLPS